MPKGKTPSAALGPGDRQYAGSHVEVVRITFLAALRAIAPDVIEKLADAHSVAGVTAWAERAHIKSQWIVSVGLETITQWAASDAMRRHLVLAQPIFKGELVPEPQSIVWAPTVETEQQFRARVDVYVDTVKQWADTIGLVPTVERRQLQRDIEAFISYQVRDWDIDAIVDEYFPDSSNDAARKALRQVADDLQITLRN